jgi:hypothetical protein
MSFIAVAPAPTHSPPLSITNDGFWPDIDITTAREAMRLDGTVTDARLVHALTAAIIEVSGDVRAWKYEQIGKGLNTLAEVPADVIAGGSMRVHAYRRAVYCLANADLIERMPDYDTTATGLKRAEQLEPAAGDHRRNARWAVSDLLGKPRTVVRLL